MVCERGEGRYVDVVMVVWWCDGVGQLRAGPRLEQSVWVSPASNTWQCCQSSGGAVSQGQLVVTGMAGSAATSWYNTNTNTLTYKSHSTEQLDKLLAGLDELSGTLPDLGGKTERKFPAEEECERVGGGRWNGSKTTGNSVSDNNSRARTLPGTTTNMRTYEEDLDYALEKEIDQAMAGHDRNVPIELECEEPQPQPYHTRYDSKPFSYIRWVWVSRQSSAVKCRPAELRQDWELWS